MDTPIQSVVEQFDTGRTIVTYGPPARLEADTLLALFRAFRSRRFAWSIKEKTSDEAGTNDVDQSLRPPDSFPSNGGGETQELLLRHTNGANLYEIALKPSAVTFADPSHDTSIQIAPREILTLVPTGTGYSIQKMQVLCSAPYADPLTLIPDGITQGDLLIGGSGNLLDRLPAGPDGQLLRIDTGSPAWQTVIPALSQGDLLTVDSNGDLTTLAIGTADQYLKATGTAAVWQTPHECPEESP